MIYYLAAFSGGSIVKCITLFPKKEKGRNQSQCFWLETENHQKDVHECWKAFVVETFSGNIDLSNLTNLDQPNLA